MNYKSMLFICFSIFILPYSFAGGIALNTTRIIYPLDARQVNVSIRNSDAHKTYLVQTWAENKNGHKSKDFISTPPLFTSGPGDENVLRLLSVNTNHPNDREELYYYNVKAIPSVDKDSISGKNALIIASVTRVKLFIRPSQIGSPGDNIISELKFKRKSGKLFVNNPTPFHITVTDFKMGTAKLPDVMISPISELAIDLNNKAAGNISYSIINDYGAVSKIRVVPNNEIL